MPSGTISPNDAISNTLDDLSASTGALNAAFDEILALPYVDVLKADEAGSITVESVVSDLRNKYAELQSKTLPVAREVYAYAVLQSRLIPQINQEDGLVLETYIRMNRSLIARRKSQTLEIKLASEGFRKEMVLVLEIMKTALGTLNDQIGEFESQIRNTKKRYDQAKSAAILGGILTALFTFAAVFTVCATFGTAGMLTGKAAVWGASIVSSLGAGSAATVFGTGVAAASTFGTGALAAFITTVVESVDAGNFHSAISALQSAKSSAENSHAQLQVVIDKMQAIETNLDVIVEVWGDIDSSLALILQDVDAWKEPDFFTPELAQETVDEWNDVADSVEKYTEVVSGETDLGSRSLPANQDPPAPVVGKALRNGIGSALLGNFMEALLAPRVSIEGQISDLDLVQNAIRVSLTLPGVSSDLNQRGMDLLKALKTTHYSIRRSCNDLSRLTNTSMACYTKILSNLGSESANGHDGLLELTVMISEVMRERVVSLEREHDAVSKSAEEAEKNVFGFQGKFGGYYNKLVQHSAELAVQKAGLERQLADIQKDRRQRKWLWLIPLAGAVNEIVDLANDVQGKINNLNRKRRGLQNCINGLSKSTNIVHAATNRSTVVSQTLSNVLNQNQEVKVFVDVVEVMDWTAPKPIFEEVVNSWEGLDMVLDDFLE